MARHPERTKSRSSIFPVKFKGFVKDVRSFTRDFKLERKSEDLGSTEKPADVIVEIPSSPTECSAPLYTANLNVQVSLQFDEPLDFSYTRHYEGSPSLVVTEKLCQGLLHRVDHCSQELITRKDANALQRTRNNGLGKAVRFELHIQINRGSDVWAVRTFTSYQKQPMTAEAAREIALETHYIIGLFLLQHDDGFVLKDGAIRDDPSQSPETHPFRAGRVQPISCVPRSYFLQGSQRFESIPGYTIHLKMINRNHRRKPSEWQNTVEVNSQQTTPLNLAIAESLFFEAAQAMETILRFERDSFENRHRSCASPDGCSYWRQHEGDGFELELSIKNNLGPQFEHLQRTVSSSIALLSHLQTGDCDKFANVLEQAFTGVRDSADEKMNSMHDLEFRIIELRGRGWALEEPLLFTIDPSSTQSRRDTEAVLDRVQAGIADILRRNAMAGYSASDGTTAAQPEGTRASEKPSQETNPENRSDITEKTSPTPEASVVSELYTVIGENSAIKQPSEAPDPEPKPGTTEPIDSLSEYEAALRSLETGIFSQSRLDFDFSSPASTSPNSPIDDLSESESLTSPTRRLSSQSHRNSFGSAGFLGFHEEKIVQVSLRRALMGSPSRKSKGSNGGSEKDTQRPRTGK
ncbi:putative pt repeat family protein [Eutypa lata UCREL1]|uniref:Putative pt repeat family protein n=1 Tax=Eutypa lata (strain UCR-EL1) TaxID=1287681 RepID=M7T0B6_EUTLA|nr:putative pt repeat family protein [Eutypa lata UCREL1]